MPRRPASSDPVSSYRCTFRSPSAGGSSRPPHCSRHAAPRSRRATRASRSSPTISRSELAVPPEAVVAGLLDACDERSSSSRSSSPTMTRSPRSGSWVTPSLWYRWRSAGSPSAANDGVGGVTASVPQQRVDRDGEHGLDRASHCLSASPAATPQHRRAVAIGGDRRDHGRSDPCRVGRRVVPYAARRSRCLRRRP